MQSKEEIEKAKMRLKNYMLHINIEPSSVVCVDCISKNKNKHIEAKVLVSEEFKYSVDKILEYIKQLESRKQKLIEKLECAIDFGKTGTDVVTKIKIECLENVLKILKGEENDE